METVDWIPTILFFMHVLNATTLKITFLLVLHAPSALSATVSIVKTSQLAPCALPPTLILTSKPASNV